MGSWRRAASEAKIEEQSAAAAAAADRALVMGNVAPTRPLTTFSASTDQTQKDESFMQLDPVQLSERLHLILHESETARLGRQKLEAQIAAVQNRTTNLEMQLESVKEELRCKQKVAQEGLLPLVRSESQLVQQAAEEREAASREIVSTVHALARSECETEALRKSVFCSCCKLQHETDAIRELKRWGQLSQDRDILRRAHREAVREGVELCESLSATREALTELAEVPGSAASSPQKPKRSLNLSALKLDASRDVNELRAERSALRASFERRSAQLRCEAQRAIEEAENIRFCAGSSRSSPTNTVTGDATDLAQTRSDLGAVVWGQWGAAVPPAVSDTPMSPYSFFSSRVASPPRRSPFLRGRSPVRHALIVPTPA